MRLSVPQNKNDFHVYQTKIYKYNEQTALLYLGPLVNILGWLCLSMTEDLTPTCVIYFQISGKKTWHFLINVYYGSGPFCLWIYPLPCACSALYHCSWVSQASVAVGVSLDLANRRYCRETAGHVKRKRKTKLFLSPSLPLGRLFCNSCVSSVVPDAQGQIHWSTSLLQESPRLLGSGDPASFLWPSKSFPQLFI